MTARRGGCALGLSRMTTQTTTTRVLLATVVGALAFLVAGVGGAAAAPAASQTPTNKCWLDVINDWADNNQVDKIYAIPCYTQAIQHLSAYPDIAGYSSAADDIHRAMLAVIHEEGRGAAAFDGRGGGGPSPPSLGGGGTTRRAAATGASCRASPTGSRPATPSRSRSRCSCSPASRSCSCSQPGRPGSPAACRPAGSTPATAPASRR